jgi:hypothetical protein
VGENMNTVKKITEALLDASREVCLEVNKQKTICSCCITRAWGKNHTINMLNKSFENVADFRYVGRSVTNQNYIHKESKARLNLEDAC